MSRPETGRSPAKKVSFLHLHVVKQMKVFLGLETMEMMPLSMTGPGPGWE
jgi:hypothetical protein